jgi:predicted nucleotide-binding protein
MRTATTTAQPRIPASSLAHTRRPTRDLADNFSQSFGFRFVNVPHLKGILENPNVAESHEMAKNKPQVFIASSVEGLAVAEAINLNLDHDTYPTLWRAGTFRLGSTSLDDLVKKSSAVDFAIFIFTPDDVATIRESDSRVVRDNVLFELGLFIGALGKERCYVVRPRDTDMHLPSDLLGVTTADYDSKRPDADLASALNGACKLIKDAIHTHGLKESPDPTNQASEKAFVANPPTYLLNPTDLKFLAECVEGSVSYPGGLGYFQISKEMKKEPVNLVRMSAIKLTRLGLIEKTVEENPHQDSVYYVYSITENGIDVFLKNEELYAVRTSARPAPHFDDMDDTPF